MPNTNYGVGGTLGVKLDRTSTVPEFKVGQVEIGNNARSWLYVGPAANAVPAGGACTVTAAFAVNNTAGPYTAPTGFAGGEYGWVHKTASPF